MAIHIHRKKKRYKGFSTIYGLGHSPGGVQTIKGTPIYAYNEALSHSKKWRWAFGPAAETAMLPVACTAVLLTPAFCRCTEGGEISGTCVGDLARLV